MFKKIFSTFLLKPLLVWIAKKTDNYKTIIGLIGSVFVIIGYIINYMYPEVTKSITPLLTEDKINEILNIMLLIFGGTTVGGVTHKIVKTQKEIKKVSDIKEDLNEIKQEIKKQKQIEEDIKLDKVTRELEHLKEIIQNNKGTITSNYNDYEQH